jgi:hypothetical protein
MNLWTFLVSAIVPLGIRLLSGLGIGWITFTGLSSAFDTLKTTAINYWGSLPSAILQLFELAGINTAFGFILGGLAFRIAYMTIPRLTKIA